MEVVSYRPERSELAWTFGGVPPVRRVRPGSVLELWTEDAFGGSVRGPDDLVSGVVEFPFVNPQTGPFHVEGPSPATPWPSTSCPSSRRGTGPPRPPSRCSGP